jgi:serralysin
MTTVWDAAGLVGDYAVDTDGDGVVDNTFRYVLDAAERVTEIVEDLGADGVIDVRGAYVYTDPTLISGTYTEDEGDDGVPELVETFASDASGNVLSFSSDSSPDGTPDFEYTFTYDAATNVLLTREFVDLSGAPNAVDHSFEATLDGQGRLVATDYVETRHATGAVVGEEQEDWVFGGSCP